MNDMSDIIRELPPDTGRLDIDSEGVISGTRSRVVAEADFEPRLATAAEQSAGALSLLRARSSERSKAFVQLTGGLSAGTGDFTVSLWMKPLSSGFVFTNKSRFNRPGMQMSLSTSGEFHFAVDDGAGFYALDTIPTLVFDGTWHLVSIVRHGATLRLFFDGQVLAAAPHGSNPNRTVSSPLPFLIGGRYPVGDVRLQDVDETLAGQFNYFRYWTVALPDAHLTAPPSSTPQRTGLRGQWDFVFNLANTLDNSAARPFGGAAIKPGNNPWVLA